MTVIGASHFAHRGGAIALEVPYSSEAWVEVARFPQSDLPDQGATESYVFVVSCLLHTFGIGAADLATVELGLGPSSSTSPDASTHCWQHLRWPRFTQVRTGLPFFWVYHRTSAFGGTWDASADDLILWARIHSIGDPPSVLASTTAHLSDVVMYAFSLKTLGANDFVHHSHSVTPSLVLQPSSQDFGDINNTGTGWGQSAGNWVVFTSTTYNPAEHPLNVVPCFQTTYSPDGTSGAQVALFGDPEGGPALGEVPLMGLRGRTGLDNSGGIYCRYRSGGATLLQNPASAAWIGLRAYDYTFGQAAASEFERWDVFALRCDASAPAGGLGAFEYLRKKTDPAGPPTGVDDIFSMDPQAVSFLAQPFELSPTSGPALQDNFLWNACPVSTQFAAGAPKSFLELTYFGSLALGTFQSGVSVFESFEGLHLFLGVPLPVLPQAAQLGLRGRSIGIALIPSELPSHDLFAMAWNWDNALQSSPFSVPAVPGAVGLDPGKESLLPGSLNPLPNGADGSQLLPDVAREVEVRLERSDFEALDGTRYTWPRFLGPRRPFAVQWTVSTADRDTLLAFFLAQEKRAFQWQPPEDQSAIAVIMVEDPVSDDLGGGIHVLSTRVVELVWTGV